MVAFPNLIVLVVLVGIAAAEHVDEASALVQLVAAQGRQLEQMQQQLQLLAAAVAAINLKVLEPAQQDREQGAAMPGYLDSEPGRRLSAPASQRTAWHHGVLHSFDIPTTCGLHAELDSDATGPMSITRSSEGNVTMGYGGAAMATQPAAFEMNHPSNCRTATLTSNHPLTVSGSLTTTGHLVVGGSVSLQGADLTSTLQALSAYPVAGYAQYVDWACSARNEVKAQPAAPTNPTFAECQTVCDKSSTCISFEYKSGTSTPCSCSNSCIPSLGQASGSAGYTCVPTPAHVPAFPARVLSAAL